RCSSVCVGAEYLLVFFFFSSRRRHTRSYGDWSSDVCSSDLIFSKTLAPGLRLGWLVGSEEAIGRCVNCGTTQMGGGANVFEKLRSEERRVGKECRCGRWRAE